MTDINWDAIRQDREQGLSLRTLALKYGISKSYIGEMLSSGQTGQTGQEKRAQTPPPLRTPPTLAEPAQAQNITTLIAQNLIRMIARHVTGKFRPEEVNLDPREMKLLADTLSQCNKVLVGEDIDNANTPVGIDWSIFTMEELTVIQPIFERALARNIPENVTAFRKQV